MPDYQPVRLICVTEDNHNKFYNMTPQGDTFLAEWGRVGYDKKSKVYPMSEWRRILKDKLKKYTDITHLVKENTTKSEFKKISDPKVDSLIATLLSFARNSVKDNYTISSDAVTVAQVSEAQGIVDELTGLMSLQQDNDPLNTLLLRLYKVIPRRMTKVQNFLVKGPIVTDSDLLAARTLVDHEQATLDVMSGQVKMKGLEPDENAPEKTMLEVLGIEVVPGDSDDVARVKQLMGYDSHEFRAVFKVVHGDSRGRYKLHVENAGNQKHELFWHGSRNENWISILQTGLRIRPSNAILTGAMFGHGIYFADKYRKSAGYTSLNGSYWTHGSSATAFLAVMDVHVGNQFKVLHHTYECSSMNKVRLKAKGNYDSLFAQGGADLKNNEYIIYDDAQSTINYFVQVGK